MATQFSVKDGRNWAPKFFTIWIGQAISLLGSQLVGFALIWYLTVETGSATILAGASMVVMLPRVVFGPFVGPLVDRWNRRLTMLVADTFIVIATVALAALFATGLAEIWHIFVLMFLRAFAGLFHGNSMAASTSLMVPVEHLTRVQGLNQTLNGGLNIVAAPLGALLYETFALPLQYILAIDVITALVAIIPLLFIAIPQPDRSESEALSGVGSTFWQDFRAGFRYVVSWKGLLIIALMATIINLVLSPAFSLLPLLVSDHFNGDAQQYGFLEAVFGVGVIVGGLVLGVWGGFKRRIFTSMFGLIGMGIGAVILGLLPSSAFVWAVVGGAIIGIFMPITNGSIGGIVQAIVAPDMQGRVLTLISSLAGFMTPVGLAVAGPLSDWFGIQTWFILGGVTCAFMGIVGALIPAVVNVEEEGNKINGNSSLPKEQEAVPAD